MENRMLTVKIKDIEMTIEEARELYKQLGDLFGPKLASLPPTNIKADFNFNKPGGYLDPRFMSNMVGGEVWNQDQ
jgi:hypothetical protein